MDNVLIYEENDKLYNGFLKCLIESEHYMNQYIDIDPYEEIFEAENEETANKIKNNEESEIKSVSSMKKASNKLVQIIQNIILAIKNFFKKRRLDKGQREALDAYRQRCKEDPSLKNKQVQALDTEKFNEASNDILKEAEEADKKLANGEDVDISSIMNKIKIFCSGAVSGFMVPIGIEAALQTASSSKEIANQELDYLNKDLELQKQISDAIGEKELKKFKKDLAALGKRQSLRGAILKLQGYKAKSVEDAFDKTINEVSNLVGGGVNIAALFMADPNGGDISKSKAANIAHTAGYAAKNAGKIGKSVKQIGSHGIKMGTKMAKNEQIQNLVKTGVGVYNDIDKTARDQYQAKKDAEKAQRAREKAAKKYEKDVKKDVSNQSLVDSLTGAHDKNAKVSHSKAVKTGASLFSKLNK